MEPSNKPKEDTKLASRVQVELTSPLVKEYYAKIPRGIKAKAIEKAITLLYSLEEYRGVYFEVEDINISPESKNSKNTEEW